MDKKKSFLILFVIILLTACTPVTPIPTQIATMATFTPSATPTASHTPTPSITPLPTIPTATPTFDIASIVTVTPAPAEQCPEEKPILDADLSSLNFRHSDNLDTYFTIQQNRADAENNILNFLNTYGVSHVIAHVEEQNYFNYIYQDLTNDGVPELAVEATSFYIFGCKDGHFETLLQLPPDGRLRSPAIIEIGDYNKNGIDEFVIWLATYSQGGYFIQMYEWHNGKFVSLPSGSSDDPYANAIFLNVTGDFHFEDIDNDGVYELITNSGIPVWSTYPDFLPWRNEKTYYKWNGEFYVPAWREYSIPDVDFVTVQEFRFQSIQDGDLATLQGEYPKALDLYQRAVFDDALSGYSLEIRENLQENWDARISNDPTPTPYPDDPSEYPKLASYAYYRIMLLQVVQSNLTEAEKNYNTLQEKFAQDQYGAPYADMARDFWQAYQQNQNMTDACGAAITYAAIHPEILIPLGSDYHGWQSHTYQPEDVCPFR